MAASHNVLAAFPTVQVLSAQLIPDVQVVTIQTTPSGVITTAPVTQESFDSGTSDNLLRGLATTIESIMAGGKVSAATGVTNIDANGLIEYATQFTVSYTPSGGAVSPLTAEVTIPTGLLGSNVLPFGAQEHLAPMAQIEAAYEKLAALAGDTVVRTPAPDGLGTLPEGG